MQERIQIWEWNKNRKRQWKTNEGIRLEAQDKEQGVEQDVKTKKVEPEENLVEPL